MVKRRRPTKQFKRVDPKILKVVARRVRHVQKNYGKPTAEVEALAIEIGRSPRQVWNYLAAGRLLLGWFP